MVVTVTVDWADNGGELSLTVYEDTDTDGAAENQDTVTLSGGGPSNTVTFHALQGGTGNEYWVDVSLSGGETTTPTVNSVTLESEPTLQRTASLTPTSTLNGGSIGATVYEDSDGDGAAENVEKVSLSGGTETIDLYGLDAGTGNDYWLAFDLTSGGAATTPTVDSATLDTVLAVTDAGSITTASGSSLTSEETATLSSPAALVTAAATPLSPAEAAELTVGTSLVDAVATVLSAAETTEAAGATVTGASAATLSPAEIAEAVESGLVSAVATPLTTSETATLSETPGVQTAAATVLSPDEFPVTTDSGVVTAAAATVQTTTTLVEDFIAGTVTLSGSGVQGAKVYVINAENDTVERTATTDANGDYGVTVPADPPYHIAVQYDDGSQKYNALSKPFVE